MMKLDRSKASDWDCWNRTICGSHQWTNWGERDIVFCPWFHALVCLDFSNLLLHKNTKKKSPWNEPRLCWLNRAYQRGTDDAWLFQQSRLAKRLFYCWGKGFYFGHLRPKREGDFFVGILGNYIRRQTAPIDEKQAVSLTKAKVLCRIKSISPLEDFSYISLNSRKKTTKSILFQEQDHSWPHILIKFYQTRSWFTPTAKCAIHLKNW